MEGRHTVTQGHLHQPTTGDGGISYREGELQGQVDELYRQRDEARSLRAGDRACEWWRWNGCALDSCAWPNCPVIPADETDVAGWLEAWRTKQNEVVLHACEPDDGSAPPGDESAFPEWDLDDMELTEIVNPEPDDDDMRLRPLLDSAILTALMESIDLSPSESTTAVLAALNRICQGLDLSVALSPVESEYGRVLDVDGEWIEDSMPPTFEATLRIEVPLRFEFRFDP